MLTRWTRSFAILIALAAITSLALAQTPTPTPIVVVTVPPVTVGPPTPTVFYVGTPQVQLSATPGCAAPLPIQDGQTAYVRGGMYLRSGPGLSNPITNYYTAPTIVTVVGSPVCDGTRYNWWRVRGPGMDGWVAEGSPGRYWVEAGPPLVGATCSAAAALVIGEDALLLRDVNVREQPAESGLVLTVASAGGNVRVLDGPRCANGRQWWQVSVTVLDVLYTGWMADGQAAGGEDYLISEAALNASVCSVPLRFAAGMRGYVNYHDGVPKSLRSAPTLQAELVATLLDGIGFEVVGGPVCADDYNWWQVQILSRPDVTGWIAEGGPANYWITREEIIKP
jgi:hypothetical protein